MNEAINKFYDHIIEVTKFQGWLMPFSVLYGDGSRFERNKEACIATYEELKKTMIENNIINANTLKLI